MDAACSVRPTELDAAPKHPAELVCVPPPPCAPRLPQRQARRRVAAGTQRVPLPTRQKPGRGGIRRGEIPHRASERVASRRGRRAVQRPAAGTTAHRLRLDAARRRERLARAPGQSPQPPELWKPLQPEDISGCIERLHKAGKVAAAKRRELTEEVERARRTAEDACCTFRPQTNRRRPPASVGGAARQSAAELHSLPLPQQVTELEGRIERGGSGAEMDGLRRLLRVKQAQLRREQLRREREEEGGGGGGEAHEVAADQNGEVPSPDTRAHRQLQRRGRRVFPQGRSVGLLGECSDDHGSPLSRLVDCVRP
eukprot:TRINITY_DN4381_c0_g1_i1.p2 TRINITY_DN4381_c0_g1~~TRINITY_DN4381_c0_g1_i1.p2  ORF type:complete len:332 (+),score=45.79 TRINITY_DN4381_c0_g1_i1:61-996(+)